MPSFQKKACSDGSISHRSPSWLQKQQPEVFVPILLGQSPLGHQETQRWSSNKRQLCLRSAQLHSLILRFEFAFDSLSFSSGLHLPYSREEVPCTESQRTSLHFFFMFSVLLTDNWNYSNVFKILKREIHHEIAHMTPEKDLKISMWFRYHFDVIFFKHILEWYGHWDIETFASCCFWFQLEALISCMVLDVFHPWPRDALIGVAERFMEVLEKNIPNEVACVFRVNFHQNSHVGSCGYKMTFLLHEFEASEFTLSI